MAQDVFWGTDKHEVDVCATSLPSDKASPGQIVMLYLKRADAENLFDEIKNQGAFSGFCSGKAAVTETAARLLLLTCNL